MTWTRPIGRKTTIVAGILLLLGLIGVAGASIPSGQLPAHQSSAVTTQSASVAETAPHGESAAAAGHGEAGGEAAAEGGKQPELPSFITVILHTKIGDTRIADTKVGHFLHVYEKQVFVVIAAAFLSLLIFGTLRLRAMIPGRTQVLMELIVEKFYTGLGAILGPGNEKYIPFLGSLFMFILVGNLMGIIPLFAASTSVFQTTVTLALIVFFYVHFNAIREAGFVHWIDHLAGSPRDVVGWCVVPLLLPLEIIGELAKPLSLSLRLYGNIMGEDILIGVFMTLGISLMGVIWHEPLVGIPLHLPFYFLALLTSTIQALVFTLLSTVYIALLLPHKTHSAGEAGAHH
jgi:F-type H+-transporting ATPase subunit a